MGAQFTVGKQDAKCGHYFCSFYPFELKVSRVVKLCIPNNRVFVCVFFWGGVGFDFNGFWRENEVTRLTAIFKF